MSRLLIGILMILALMSSGGLLAQPSVPPDYAVSDVRREFSADGTRITLEFRVQNLGGPADQDATINIVALDNGRVLATDILRPLEGQEAVLIRFELDPATFSPGSVQPLQIEVGLDEVESLLGETIQNNYAGISITIPGTPQTETPDPVLSAEPDSVIVIPIPFLEAEIAIDTADRTQMALAAGIAGAVGLVLLLGIIIVRLLFNSPPVFGTWQAPYANVPPLGDDTSAGRRQMWQQHAENGSILVPCTEDAIHARKRLIGMDGGNFSNWEITALRISQYDMYGRVTRTQVLASKGLVRKLDGVRRRSRTLSRADLHKKVRPVAKGLANRFKKKVNKRNAMLPIALDIRLKGGHGEVRIVFELFHCKGNTWHQIDQWEPEMTVLGRTIYESYTYTLLGQTGGESLKELHIRLLRDLEHLLVEMLGWQQAPASTQTDGLTDIPSIDSEPQPGLAPED
jgi:hypothetical protein